MKNAIKSSPSAALSGIAEPAEDMPAATVMPSVVAADSGNTETQAAIDLSLVIPVFNEEDNIDPLIDRISEALADYGKPWELVLVDDGSTDATLARARKALNERTRHGLALSIVELQRNFGQTAAMQAGIDIARGRLIATLDGDLQNDPHDIVRMAAALEERDLDLLVGWRKDREDDLFVRKIPSWCANALIGRMTGVKLHDYGCSLKIYRGSVIRQVRLMGEMHRFIPAWVANVVPSSRIGEIVVSHHARRHGTSKYGLSRTFRVLLDLLAVLFFMRFRGRPGHFFGSLGLVAGVVSGLILTYLAIDKFAFGNDIGGRPLFLVGIMLFLSSLQLITTGILAELIVRMGGREKTNLPYIIRETHRGES